ncbi:putative exported protein [Vibrio maritimus]|uniref:Putative exported protein n=1 Tax=Vibrio maritimus TaxID=990268 RepID=A0A090TPF1_9VIBR|nr:putative exported protein [Vibrio maritimus]
MRKSLLALGVVAAVAAVPASAEYLYGFGGVYLDHQSWDHGPNAIQDGQDGKGRNQFVLGIEGGAGFTWGELYGFYDRESVEKSSSEQKNSMKGTAHIYLGDSGVSLYGQVYHHDNPAQSETNRVLGLGYTALKGDNWFFKPWLVFTTSLLGILSHQTQMLMAATVTWLVGLHATVSKHLVKTSHSLTGTRSSLIATTHTLKTKVVKTA